MLQFRPEAPDDLLPIEKVNAQAFPTKAEAHLVNQLRESGDLQLSLVATLDESIIGHIAFSPVTVNGVTLSPPALGLAPVAVLPDFQGWGVGSQLIENGLTECRKRRTPFVVVLGEPAYYWRFGFTRAADFQLQNEYGVDAEFMVLPVDAGQIELVIGMVRYSSAFVDLS